MITDDDIRKAWASIARTEAGRVAYLHLQKIRMEVEPSPDAGVLQRDAGRRSFAAELMGHMAQDISEAKSDGRDDDAGAGQRSNERPIVFGANQPTDLRRRRSFRDYAIEHDPELRDHKSGSGTS